MLKTDFKNYRIKVLDVNFLFSCLTFESSIYAFLIHLIWKMGADFCLFLFSKSDNEGEIIELRIFIYKTVDY